VCNILIAV